MENLSLEELIEKIDEIKNIVENTDGNINTIVSDGITVNKWTAKEAVNGVQGKNTRDGSKTFYREARRLLVNIDSNINTIVSNLSRIGSNGNTGNTGNSPAVGATAATTQTQTPPASPANGNNTQSPSNNTTSQTSNSSSNSSGFLFNLSKWYLTAMGKEHVVDSLMGTKKSKNSNANTTQSTSNNTQTTSNTPTPPNNTPTPPNNTTNSTSNGTPTSPSNNTPVPPGNNTPPPSNNTPATSAATAASSGGGGKSGGKAAVIMAAANMFTDQIIGLYKSYKKWEFAKFDAAQNQIVSTMNTKLGLLTATIQKTFGTTIGGIFKDNLIDVAYEAYDNMLDLAKQNFSATLDMQKYQRDYDLAIYKANTEAINAAGEALSSTLSLIPGGVGIIASGLVSIGTKLYGVYREMNAQEQERFNKMLDNVAEAKKKMFESAEEIVKTIKETAKNVEKMQLEVDREARKAGLTMGYSGKNLENFVRKQLVDASDKMISQFGKTGQDLIKMQAAYSSASERNVTLTKEEEAGILSLETMTGFSSEQLAEMIGGMHKYNISVSEGNDLIHDMYKTATRMGVNANKAVKTFTDNLTLASKVNFKRGVDGLKEMASWSLKTRFNMENIGGMVDKILSVGLEGIIQSSAQLSVLGGNAAMYADPIGMMYGMNDAQDLAERLSKSIEGIGTYDRSTGQTTFNYYDRLRMKAIADAYGVSSEQLDIMARTQKQRGDVASRVSGHGFNEEQIDLLNSNAKFNKETGKYEVSMVTAGGQTVTRDISQLTPDDLKNIIPENEDEALVDYAARNLSEATKQTAAIISVRNILAAQTMPDFKGESMKRIKAWSDFYEKNQNALAEATINEMELSTYSLQKNFEASATALQKGGVYWESSDTLKAEFSHLAMDAQNLGKQFRDLNRAMASGDWKAYLRFGGATEEDIEMVASYDKDIHDGVVQFDSGDEILAGKKGGGLHDMMYNTSAGVQLLLRDRSNPKVMPIESNPVKSNSGDSVRNFWGGNQPTQSNGTQKVEFNPISGKIDLNLNTKDGQSVDLWKLVNNTEFMRTLYDRLKHVVARESSGFNVDSETTWKNYR